MTLLFFMGLSLVFKKRGHIYFVTNVGRMIRIKIWRNKKMKSLFEYKLTNGMFEKCEHLVHEIKHVYDENGNCAFVSYYFPVVDINSTSIAKVTIEGKGELHNRLVDINGKQCVRLFTLEDITEPKALVNMRMHLEDYYGEYFMLR